MPSPEQTPITGAEDACGGTTPHGALAEFYRAFNGRDLVLMQQNWCAGEDPVMDNPLGGIRRGWAAIRPTYETLFGSPKTVSVEFFDYTIHPLGPGFVAIGRERGSLCSAGEPDLALAIRTTRAFVRVGERFRQLHHHGSIDDPDLLRRYRDAFR